MSDGSSEIKSSVPNFDGKYSEYKPWLRDLDLYFELNSKKFDSDKPKVLYTIGKMKGGTAGSWANRWYDEYRKDKMTGTWDELIRQLNVIFTDHMAQQKAHTKLDTFKQGNHRIDNFFTAFENIASEAGVDKDDKLLIWTLRHNINRKLIEQLATTQDLPTVYADFKLHICRLGRLREQWEDELKGRERQTPVLRLRDTMSMPPAKPAFPVTDRKTPTGTVFGGAGRPMDLDTAKANFRCFNCGELGHMRKECPKSDKRPFHARLIVQEMTKEERKELIEELNSEGKDDDTIQDFA